MVKRIIAVFLTILMASAFFAGCGTSTESGKPDSSSVQTESKSAAESAATQSEKSEPREPVTLAIWHTNAEDNSPDKMHGRLETFAAKYQQEFPYVTVKLTGNMNMEKILTALSSGQGPDIFINQWPNCATWSDKGALMDLTDLVNNDKAFDKSDISDSLWSRGTYKNKIYGIPQEVFSTELYYNKDLLAKQGYTEPPETIEQMVEMALKLTKYDSDGSIVQAGFIPDVPWFDHVVWPVAFGAKWIDPATNKITFDSAEMAAAYQWQVDIYDKIGRNKLLKFKGGLGKFDDVTDPFLNGKLAMQFSGEWTLGTISRIKPDLNYGVAAIPYPKDHPEVKGSMFVTASVWCMNANTKSKDESWKLLSALTSKEQMKLFAEGTAKAGC
jgi:multiple sugar transport system substrate-binding protein